MTTVEILYASVFSLAIHCLFSGLSLSERRTSHVRRCDHCESFPYISAGPTCSPEMPPTPEVNVSRLATTGPFKSTSLVRLRPHKNS